MLTSLGLSRNLYSKITINTWHNVVGSIHSLMRIQEYWTTYGLAMGRGFTYLVMWIPKTHVCGVVKTRMHCSRNPSIPRKSACSVHYHSDTTTWKHASTLHLSSRISWVLCVITAANNWAHVLRHNCNKSSVHWTYRRTFPAPPVTTTLHTGMTCKCKPTFFGATFKWDALYKETAHLKLQITINVYIETSVRNKCRCSLVSIYIYWLIHAQQDA
jgi:hypothetical protein